MRIHWNMLYYLLALYLVCIFNYSSYGFTVNLQWRVTKQRIPISRPETCCTDETTKRGDYLLTLLDYYKQL